MAAAHLLAASAAASSSTTAFHPTLRLRSPPQPPHLRFNRTGRRPFPVVRAAETDAKDAKANAKAPEKAPAADGSSFNQLLGIKGAKQESDIWKIRLQLTKPVTWPPLVWGVLCGAAASGNFHWTVEDVAKSIVCMIMSGPCLTGYTQTLNDWYDRDIDAINEPYRPIPSGAISENENVILQVEALGVLYYIYTTNKRLSLRTGMLVLQRHYWFAPKVSTWTHVSMGVDKQAINLEMLPSFE